MTAIQKNQQALDQIKDLLKARKMSIYHLARLMNAGRGTAATKNYARTLGRWLAGTHKVRLIDYYLIMEVLEEA